MSDQRDGGIAWTDQTWNPTRGCSRVSKGCEHCYAEGVARRFSGPGQPYEGLVRLDRDGKAKAQWSGVVRLVPDHLGDPMRWKRPRRVFVNSMSDLFHEALSIPDIARVFAVMAQAERHTFQVLTKRAKRMREVLASELFWADVDLAHIGLFSGDGGTEDDRDRVAKACAAQRLRNVWLGTSIEDQATADERIPQLLACPAAVRFVSYEPAIGPVDFSHWIAPTTCCNGCGDSHGGEHQLCPSCGEDNAITTWGVDQFARWSTGERYAANDGAGHEDIDRGSPLDWIVVGGESGLGARPFDLAWARSTIAQCRAAGVACFVKQLGASPRVWTGERGYTPDVFDLPELRLRDRKGGDIDEWPKDLRVRQWPEVRRG